MSRLRLMFLGAAAFAAATGARAAPRAIAVAQRKMSRSRDIAQILRPVAQMLH